MEVKSEIEELRRIYSEGKLIPFIGTGLSYPFSVPDWATLIRKIAGKHLQPSIVSIIDKHLDKNEYWEAVDILKDHSALSEFQLQEDICNELKTCVNVEIDDSMHNYSNIVGMNFKIYFTTNYDLLLSKYINNPSCVPQVLSKAKINSQKIFEIRDYPQLWYLHGHIEDTGSIVISREVYEQLYNDEKYKNLFTVVQGVGTFLFMGFSFNDVYIRDLLARNNKSLNTTHYIMLESPTDEIKKNFANKFNIKVIGYQAINGNHAPAIRDILEQILTPTVKEELQKIRYQDNSKVQGNSIVDGIDLSGKSDENITPSASYNQLAIETQPYPKQSNTFPQNLALPMNGTSGYIQTKDYFNYYANNHSPALKKIIAVMKKSRADGDSSALLDVKIYFNGDEKNLLTDIIPLLPPRSVMFLLGNGGSGKTYTFLKTWEAIHNSYCSIFIRLHMLDAENATIKSVINSSVLRGIQKKIDGFYDFWKEAENTRPLILLLDGFNEISEDSQESVWKEVRSLVNDLNVIVLISSRYADNLKHRVHNVFRADMVDLDKDKIRSFLTSHNADTKAVNNISLLNLLKNPLMLSLYAETAEYYDAVKTNETRLEFGGSIKFYGPIYSESTIIWNFFQHELMKEFRETTISVEDKLFSFLAVNLVLPYVCYKMQLSTHSKEQFNISDIKLSEEINNALEVYSDSIGRFDRFAALKQKLTFAETFSLHAVNMVERIKFILTIKLQLFCQLNFVNPNQHGKDETLFSLSHQQLRDCLAAIYLLNGMELCGNNELLIDLAVDDIRTNQSMVRHIAFIEQRNERTNIDKQWEFLRGKRDIEISNSEKYVHFSLDLFLNNLVNIYKYITYGDFSELSFFNIDLRNVSLSSYNFQPVKNKNLFQNSTFGTKTFSLGGHSGTIFNLAACGNTLVSRDPDSVRVWNANTSECIDIPYISEEYNEEVKGLGVDILPTNECVIAYSQSSYIVERNIETNMERIFEGANGKISYVKYSPNGNYLMAYSDENNMVTIWSLNENQKPIYSVKQKGMTRPSLSDSQLAYCSDFNEVCICEFVTQKKEISLPIKLSENELLSAISFCSNESIIAVSITKRILEYDVDHNEINTNEFGRSSSVIELWKVGDLTPIACLDDCNSVVNFIAVHPNNTFLAVTTIDRAMLLWNIEATISQGKAATLIAHYVGGITSVAFFSSISDRLSNSAQRYQERGVFVGYSYGKIQSYEIYEYKGDIKSKDYHVYTVTNYTGHKPYVYDISLNSKKNTIIGAYSDGCIREWDITNKLIIHNYTENPSFVYCVEYELNGEFFASGHTDGSLWLWDSSTNAPLGQLKDDGNNAHEEAVRDLKFTNDGRLISCSNDKTIKIWNIETQELIATLTGHKDFVKCLLYYADSNVKHIVSGSTDKSIIIWDATNIKECKAKHIIMEHTERIRSMALCYKRHAFVSNSEDGYIYEWDIITGKKTERKVFVSFDGYEDYSFKRSAESISYSPDGERILFDTDILGLADTGIQATIEEWDFTKNQLLHKIVTHTGSISCVTYGVDSKYSISGSLDGNIVVADLQTEEIMQTITPSTSFSEKLEGYDRSTVIFYPKWIKGYYFGSIETEYKNVLLPSEEMFVDYASSIRNNITVNPFNYISRNASDEEAEVQLTILVDLLIKNTSGLHGAGDRATEAREKNLLLANILYLYYEAPPDEQNMLLVCELLIARLDSQNREDNQEFEADLDRLFGMLKEKKPNHGALKLYNKFKNEYGKKEIVISCLNRIFTICAFYKECREMLNRLNINVKYAEYLAESFISNTSYLSRYQNDISTEEHELIYQIVACVATESNLWDKANIFAYVENLAKAVLGNDEYHFSYNIEKFLKNSKYLVVEKALVSIISRLSLWQELGNQRIKDINIKKHLSTLTERIETVYYSYKIVSGIATKQHIVLFNESAANATFSIVSVIEESDKMYYAVFPYIDVDTSEITDVDFSNMSLYLLCKYHNKYSDESTVYFVTNVSDLNTLYGRFCEVISDNNNYELDTKTHQNQKNLFETVKKISEAQTGNAISAYELGKMFVNGDGVPCVVSDSVKWYLLAGSLGNDAAFYELGQLWYNGTGVSQNYSRAMEWFLKSAKSNSDAQCSLGYMYSTGTGVKKDIYKANEWYTKSADNNNALAQYNLGTMYDNGEGIRKSNRTAVHLYRKSSEQGYKSATRALAIKYYLGKGVLRNYKIAYKLFSSLPQDNVTLYYLGCMYAKGQGCTKNYNRAIRCFEISARENRNSQYQLGFAYLKGKMDLQKNLELAEKWLTLAANNGQYQAQLILIIGYMNGKYSFEKNQQNAAYWHKKAVDCGNPHFAIRILNGVFDDVDD